MISMPILSRAKSYAWAIFSLTARRVTWLERHVTTHNSRVVCTLTCSWAAFLWSLEHTRGNISTGRCVTLSWGTSETTGQGRTRLERLNTDKTQILIRLNTTHLGRPKIQLAQWALTACPVRRITNVILTGNHMPDLGMSVTQHHLRGPDFSCSQPDLKA